MKEKENCAGCAYVCSRAKNGEFPPCLTPPKRAGIDSVDNWLSRQYMDFRALQDHLRWGDYDGCAYLRVNKKKLLDRYRTEWAKVNPKPIDEAEAVRRLASKEALHAVERITENLTELVSLLTQKGGHQ